MIGRARGRFAGLPRKRSWEVRLVGVPRPRIVRVAGRRTESWAYEDASRTLVVQAGELPSRRPATIVVR